MDNGVLSAANSIGAPLAVVLGAIAVVAFVLWRPKAALHLSFFLIVLAATKFRARDATALLSGDLDAQVIFELLCYAVALFAVAVNVVPAFRREPAVRATRIEMLLGGYVVLAMASVAWSDTAQVTAGRALQLAILYILCAVAVRRLGAGRTLRTLGASLVLYVLLAAGMAAALPWARHPGAFFSWFAVHPADAGSFAGSAALIMIAAAVYAPETWRPPLRRLALWAGIIACLWVLKAAHERTPAFAFAAGASTLWLRRYLRPWTAGLALCAVVAVWGVGLRTITGSYDETAGASSDLRNRFAGYVLRGQSGEEFLGLSGRVELWDYESSLIRERPLIGYGYVASRSILLDRFAWAGTSHGALPEVVLNFGLIGAALLGVIVAATLVSAFARTGARAVPDPWGQAVVLGAFVFLLVQAVANDSFAGAPGNEVLLFFAATMAHEHLARARAPRRRSGAISGGERAGR